MLRIGDRPVGPESPPFIIAEVAQSHEGSLGNAFAFASIARDCGAHAIKFQTHIAAEESTPAEPWRIPFSRQDDSRYAYWQRMEFTFEQWAALKEHCDAIGITFLSSPFSIEACQWLDRLQMPAWKVASGEIHNDQLLDFMRASGKPVLLSTGLIDVSAATAKVRALADAGTPVGLFHCTTKYPTPPEEVGLNLLSSYIDSLPGVPIGLSDHSGTITAGTIASYLGAAMIEVHLTMHRSAFGPDVSSSLEPDQLRALVTASEQAWAMRRHPIDKRDQLAGLGDVTRIFTRSLCAARDLPVGTVIDDAMLSYKKPAGGLRYEQRGQLLGRTTLRAIARDEMIGTDDVA